MVTEDTTVSDRVAALLAEHPVFDGHNDLMSRLRESHRYDLAAADLHSVSASRHTDIPRLRAGGVGAQFWSVFVPATLPEPAAVVATLEQIDGVYALAARHPDVFALAGTAAETRTIMASGRIASLLGAEGGHQIAGSLGVLRMYHALGVRYLTLTHGSTTSWADSATDTEIHGGLTPFGRDVVTAMNRLGMLVDLSHVSAETMSDTLDTSRAPVIFSHSSCRELTNHPRNVPTGIMERVPANGGVQMLTMVPEFVNEACANHALDRDRVAARLGIHPYDPGDRARDPAAADELDAWDGSHPRPVATVDDVADHIEFAREVVGIGHIGLGADFDGIAHLPDGIGGVDGYPRVLAVLVERGWSDGDLARLTCRNILRVLEEAEVAAW